MGNRLVVIVGLWLAACGDSSEQEAAKQEKERAAAAAKAMEAETKALLEQLERVQRDLAELDAKIKIAVDGVVDAMNDADRSAATAKLRDLQKQKAEMEQRVAEAKARAARAEHLRAAP